MFLKAFIKNYSMIEKLILNGTTLIKKNNLYDIRNRLSCDFKLNSNLKIFKFSTFFERNSYKTIIANRNVIRKTNNIFYMNKKNFTLGYRAEDLDAKPIQKNKYDNVKLSFGSEARKNLLEGIKTISDNVAITYGPLGKNVVIDYEDNPIVTKDGVTVAKHISLTKRQKNLGCRLLSHIAGNTNEFAGDGTTTATVLAGELSK